jgi:hypothetical protein
VRNKSASKNLFLLVVRDLDIFCQTWQEVYRFLLFQSKQKNPKTTAVKTDIIGVFVDPSLSLPDGFLLDNSFGLSGVWSLFEIHASCCEKSTRRQEVDLLLPTLLKARSLKSKDQGNEDQIFFPAFKKNISRDIIMKTLRAIEQKYSFPVKRFFLFHYKTNAFSFENL